MIVDHVGYFLLGNATLWRGIGRFSFPIFVFLLVDGYRNTRDVKKYATRILAFWAISIVPYSFAFYGRLLAAPQNIYVSLYLYLCMFIVLDKKDLPILNKAAFVICLAVLCEYLSISYGCYGVAVALIMFLQKDVDLSETFAWMWAACFVYSMKIGVRLPLAASFSVALVPPDGELAPSNPPSRFVSMLMYLFYPLHLLFFAILLL